MGNVLLKFDPFYMSSLYSENAEDAEIIVNALFRTEEWRLSDAGAIPQELVLTRALERAPERLRGTVKKVFEEFPAHMTPIEGALEFVREKKEAGYGIYLLSNVSVRFDEIYPLYPVFGYFDGIVISAKERLMKPDPRIYRLTLERFSLAAGECVFFDDLKENTDAAEVCGIHGIVFSGNWDDYC